MADNSEFQNKNLTRRQFIGAGLAAGAYTLLGSQIPAWAGDSKRKMNVLFIAIDDLRPDIGCYGVPGIKTPNIDAIAKRGTIFNRCYCQQALCSPSRSSLLTGLRPDTTKIYDLRENFRKYVPDAVALPEQFKLNGYHTQGLSKIYHPGLDDKQSWSVPHWDPNQTASDEEMLKAELYYESADGSKPEKGTNTTLPWADPDVPDNALLDGKTADQAIQVLGEIKDKPFFLAVGFLKPHLPFVAPKKYYDMYPLDDIKSADNPYPPKDCPSYALTEWEGLRAYWGIPKTGPVTDQQARELIRGYRAATSYTDAQIGRVVNELDRLGLRDNTIIVVWGDHGWQLGEHGLWCKQTNFELATRSPLIMSVPGQKNPGTKTNALSEFVDIYPTLCDLCGVPIPDTLEGRSLVPTMNYPNRAWKQAAFSQYPRGKAIMGHSMRTDGYRYTEWVHTDKGLVGTELYDHKKDPGENVNIANLPENKELVAKLSRILKAGWREALPEAR